MGIEHRWSERKPIAMDVTLHYEPIGRIKTRTRDVSLEGMFVETGGFDIPPRVELQVSFSTGARGNECVHCVPAYVVHRNDTGVGLMLRHEGYQDFYALRSVLRAA